MGVIYKNGKKYSGGRSRSSGSSFIVTQRKESESQKILPMGAASFGFTGLAPNGYKIASILEITTSNPYCNIKQYNISDDGKTLWVDVRNISDSEVYSKVIVRALCVSTNEIIYEYANGKEF